MAEGVRAVDALLQSPIVVRGALVAPQLAGTARGEALRAALAGRGVEVQEVGAREFASAAETDSPQGVLAIAEVPQHGWDEVVAGSGTRVLALDAVQDPGNAGTMVRTGAAFGAAAVVALPGTVDLWNAKVVRSAMGAQFTRAVFATTWDALDRWRSANGVTLWGADAQGVPLPALRSEIPGRLALAVGNEGAGLTAEARRRAGRLVSLPIEGVESLNVAVAAGILLYELRA